MTNYCIAGSLRFYRLFFILHYIFCVLLSACSVLLYNFFYILLYQGIKVFKRWVNSNVGQVRTIFMVFVGFGPWTISYTKVHLSIHLATAASSVNICVNSLSSAEMVLFGYFKINWCQEKLCFEKTVINGISDVVINWQWWSCDKSNVKPDFEGTQNSLFSKWRSVIILLS